MKREVFTAETPRTRRDNGNGSNKGLAPRKRGELQKADALRKEWMPRVEESEVSDQSRKTALFLRG